MPPRQTYSCLPFGNVVYHLSVTLNAVSSPLAAFAAHFFPTWRTRDVLALTAGGCAFAGFVLATALSSPELIAGKDAGGAITVRSDQTFSHKVAKSLLKTFSLQKNCNFLLQSN